MDYAIGIDVGGTVTKIALVSADRQAIAHGRLPTEAAAGPEPFLLRLRDAVDALCDAHGLRRVDARRAGVGIAGLVDHARGVLDTAPNLTGFEGIPIAERFEAALAVDVVYDNDAATCALAEALEGAGRGARFLVCVTLGTGVGGGIVAGGRIVRGARGMSGEIGHMPFVHEGEPCACGHRGCFEPYVNAGALVRHARHRTAEAPNSAPAQWRRALAADGLEARHVGEAAAAGEPGGVAVLREVGRDLGRGVAMIVSALNPDCVVVGGGVAQAGEALLDAARASLAEHVLPALACGLSLEPAALRDHGGVLGAAFLALDAGQRVTVADGDF